ncbi:phosphotransferase family protein [Kitasatospora sp. NPDC006697]|uniref:phosphotransferase family protein n=1 Tax=Kitasatospora sp. NPDC006697 TaxID=3364020 RepID=UPI00369F3AE7
MSTPVLVGGFAAAEATRILDAACRLAGLDPTGAVLLRGHTNAVFRLRSAPVVAKVARSGTQLAEVSRTVRLIQWLTSLDFPTVRLFPVEQPVVVEAHAVTFWVYLPQPDHPVSAAQIADPLRQLHQLPTPPVPLRALDTVGAIRRSIGAITVLGADDLQFLTDRVDHLEKELAALRYPLPPAILQGDPQHRNALHDGPDAVLCDWDTTAFGPPEMDLVTVEIHCRRFGYGKAHYRAFADRYGFDVTAWEGYPVLRDLRELRMITTNAKRTDASGRTLAEVADRIDGLRRGDDGMRWHIL